MRMAQNFWGVFNHHTDYSSVMSAVKIGGGGGGGARGRLLTGAITVQIPGSVFLGGTRTPGFEA